MCAKEASAVNMNVGLVAQGALAIAMVTVFFLLFRGVTNIFNALLVPLALYAFSRGNRLEEILTVYAGVLIFVALFFKMQLIFMLLYFVIAFLLDLLLKEEGRHTLMATLTISLAISLGFWVAIVLTDDLFGTRIHDMTLAMLGGNAFAYAIMLWIEGFLVSVGLLYFAEKLAKVL
jgi:hypothetical protein